MLELADNSECAHGGGADAQDRIGDEAGKCIAGFTDLLPLDELRGHLADSPRLVRQHRHDCWSRL